MKINTLLEINTCNLLDTSNKELIKNEYVRTQLTYF